jgi:peroxiredoxin Q/BCP
MKLWFLIFCAMFPFSLFAKEPLGVGAVLPTFEAVDQDGAKHAFSAETAPRMLLFFFYPKASTPGCTAQACSLRDNFKELTDKGIQIYGVSSDSVESQKRFHERQLLPFPLLADRDKVVLDLFGVPTTLGMAHRQAYLFHNGKLVWRDLKAKTSDQAKDILEALKTLNLVEQNQSESIVQETQSLH